ncbi:hypothetical protein AAF712_015783 [Marasmius tenuissimus]|uniref:Uncharacterized protein n=1 Tax=Marasmius tenuissimus TaxID=585030 RepID=A0ABR2Z8L8_9AGAR
MSADELDRLQTRNRTVDHPLLVEDYEAPGVALFDDAEFIVQANGTGNGSSDEEDDSDSEGNRSDEKEVDSDCKDGHDVAESSEEDSRHSEEDSQPSTEDESSDSEFVPPRHLVVLSRAQGHPPGTFIGFGAGPS